MANQPQAKSDGFVPKWRHFHPQATVWVKNPFDHDVLFNVADERNNPYQYRMPAGKISELPGGAVATLGVKAIIDELIQSSPKDALSMWEKGVREKYEAEIIVRVKEAPQSVTQRSTGEVNLGVADDAFEEDEGEQVTAEEAPVYPTQHEEPPMPAPAQLDSEVSAVASATLAGQQDQVIDEE